MAIEITRYTAEHILNVRSFNARLVAGGEGDYQLPKDLRQFENSASGPLPWEGWLALVDGVVRGGYLLRKQQFQLAGDTSTVAFYNLSPSEGSIDKQYAPVSMKMLTDVMRREPLLFALGMGGVSKRLPQFLKALGWRLHEIPFLFRAVRPGRVLRNISALRATPGRRLAADVAAWTGAATLGLGALQTWKRISSGRARAGAAIDEVPVFSSWADQLWAATKAVHSLAGVRNAEALNALYPATTARLHRLRVAHASRVVGWAVVRATQMRGHKQFGNLHVGTLVDCLAAEADAALVAEAAERCLEGLGVDIIVSNQSHRLWRAALLDRGYLTGPSNYALAMSKGLISRLLPSDPELDRIHITRGDGDGPIHL